MKKMLLMLLPVALVGCATQGVSTVSRVDNKPEKVANEATIQAPYTKVWDHLVRELSKSFFVINNIDKESRIINLSVNTNAPKEYIDCGKTTRTYTEGGLVEKFEYQVAEKSSFKVATPLQPHPASAYYYQGERSHRLEGRFNIYFAPAEGHQNWTSVTAYTRYFS